MSSPNRKSTPAPLTRSTIAEWWGDGEAEIDQYAWLHDRDDPRVVAHLEHETARTDRRLARCSALRGRLYAEMLDRIDLNRHTVPVRHGAYEYYSRNEEDKSYAVHCRKGLEPDA